ncbi:MAG TPA: hypothetical protein VFT39_19605 [Vicinamibacterales bacterium]|nr:hypothetical protein [Vicinamibacterales bacterium]
MDRSRRYVMSGGMGAATLNPGGHPIENGAPSTLDFEHSLSTQASFGRRLGAPTPHMTIYADASGAVVWGSGLRGVEAPSSCNVHWQSVGPALGLHFATPSPTAFEVQGGMAFVHASRPRCAAAGSVTEGKSATIVSPMIGASVIFGLTPRIGWSLGGQWLQVPLDRLELQNGRHWGGIGAVSVVLTFPAGAAAARTVVKR